MAARGAGRRWLPICLYGNSFVWGALQGQLGVPILVDRSSPPEVSAVAGGSKAQAVSESLSFSSLHP